MGSSTKRNATDSNTAVAYLRVSTDRQELGPEAQRAAIEAWAAREGVTVAAWHVDAGVSGAAAIADRPELVAALASLTVHRAGVLVVAKRDRLARDVMAAAMLERMALDAGARIVSAAGEGTDSNDPSAVLMRTLVDAFAQYERAMIAARTKAALGAKRARGERAGTVPYGFTSDAAGRLSPCPAERAIIAQVHALRAAGVTLRGIVAELARAGVVGRTGNTLAMAQVQNILARAAA
jgi:DNA invertase Pin-like site-specific DNA recombinase